MREVVYLSGPYRARGDRTIEDHIAIARSVAIKLWETGYAVICPHLNTAYFERDCDLPEERFLEGDLLILERCDRVVMLPEWEQSEGARLEREWAMTHDVPVCYWPEVLGG